ALTDSIRDLDANSTVPEIRLAVQKLMGPKLDRFTSELIGFSFNLSKLNLRDVSKSLNADLDGTTIDWQHPYFRSQCLKTDKKTNQVRFQKPQTPFRLLLVIPSDEWLRYETEMDRFERIKVATQTQVITSDVTTFSVRPPDTDTETTRTSNKRPRSVSTATPTTPPQSKRTPVLFTSPSRDQVAQALVSGGIQSEKRLNMSAHAVMQGLVAPIPIVSLLDIIHSVDGSKHKFVFDSLALPSVALLQADLRFENELGFGAFKTCHPATLISPNETPLTSVRFVNSDSASDT
ncbi:hypothetical protein K435DRAFT_814548, partial [Dendrothele bispora CBS 962.96]